jgi:hypothetical protein
MKWHLIKRKLKNCDKIYRYHEWLDGKYKDDKIIQSTIGEVILDYTNIFKNNLFSSYVDEEYTIKEFHEDVSIAKTNYNCDAIILDHLHFFDLTSQNENQEMKLIIKKISAYCKCYDVPIIAIAHIRKGLTKLVPSMDDIHGSSDIAKIATKVITFSHARDIGKRSPELVPTYFKVWKARKVGGTDYYLLLCDFDLRDYEYQKDFNIYYTNFEETKLVDIDKKHWPYWYNFEYKRKEY